MKRSGIALVVIVGFIGLLAWVTATGEEQAREQSAAVLAAHRSVTIGTPEAVVERRLGEPAFVRPITVDGRTARCWIYPFYESTADVQSDMLFRFCFSAGRLVASPDPLEPNDDIYFVRPNGLLRPTGAQTLNSPGRVSVFVNASLDWPDDDSDEFYDGIDVYRLRVPPRSALRVRVVPTANVELEVWDSTAASVFAEGDARRRHLIAESIEPGTRPDEVTIARRPAAAGIVVYVVVYLLEHGPSHAEYALTVERAGA